MGKHDGPSHTSYFGLGTVTSTQGSCPGNDEDHSWDDESDQVDQLSGAFARTENQSCDTEENEEHSEADGNFGLLDIEQYIYPRLDERRIEGVFANHGVADSTADDVAAFGSQHCPCAACRHSGNAFARCSGDRTDHRTHRELGDGLRVSGGQGVDETAGPRRQHSTIRPARLRALRSAGRIAARAALLPTVAPLANY
ncbi:hypothetical protein [Curtobacterium sp. PhB25]|uniref:hypothetical protein n=1 Tax=Curtobacterium sp. PhB25 TaxID=2485205 RepID=UPI00106469A3|nr:hypothetical protein [Curtobacterium sp. PhB25]